MSRAAAGTTPLKLHTKILLGLIAGAITGVSANIFAPGAGWVRGFTEYVANPVGQIFLRMLLMTVVPLVFVSIVLGVASLGDVRRLGRVGGRTLAYFLLSTAISAIIGLTLVNLVRPGDAMDPQVQRQLFEAYRTQAEGMTAGIETRFGIGTFISIVPRNPVQSAASMDMLGLIFFSVVFGAALTLISETKAKPVIALLDGVGDAIIKIIDFAMKLAPYGVFGLIFVVTARFGWQLLQQLGMYVAIVVIGLALHAAVGLSILVRLFGRMDPLTFWRKTRASAVTAFSTSSSNATLPTNIAVAERELGVPSHVAGFVLPMGATMNMNGTALYEGVTVLFLAQVFGVGLDLGQQTIVVVLAVLTAVGAAGVPGGSLPLIMVILATVGVPAEAIGIILGVDRILDMCRTTVNVTGDLTAAVYVARTETEWRPSSPAGGAG